MKRILSTIICVLFIFCSSDSELSKMSVQGKIDGLKKGKLFLKTQIDSTVVSVDSIIINGKSDFKLETFIEEPDIFYLVLDKEDGDSLNDIITFFGNKGEIILNSSLKTFDSSFEIIGSKNTDLLIEYFSIIRKYNNQNLDLLETYYNSQLENNQKRVDSVNTLLDNLITRKYLYTLNFAITNSSNEISPYIAVSQIPDANKELLLKIYDTLPDKIKSSKYGKILNNLSDTDN